MKLHRYVVVLLSYAALCGGASGSGETTIVESWAVFMHDPDMVNAEGLIRDLSDTVQKCDWGAAENQLAAPQEIRQSLFDHIRAGNNASLKVGFFVERCFDGGDLGDLKRSAGQHFDKNPNDFISVAVGTSISPELFTSTLTALPLTIVDKIDEQISTIRRRIELLSALNMQQDAKLKTCGLAALGDQERSLLAVLDSN